MQIWVGLGNPGTQYAMHRHNVGFMAADVIADMHSFSPPKKQFQGWVQEGRIGPQKIILLKPATFMNESGRSVGDAISCIDYFCTRLFLATSCWGDLY